MNEIVTQPPPGDEFNHGKQIGPPPLESKQTVHSGHDDTARPDAAKSGMPSVWIFVGAFVCLAALLAWGVYIHAERDAKADASLREATSNVPRVNIVTIKAQTGAIVLKLPGHTEAFDTASIYPRATGYISERLVDIGSRVKKGDLLVHIAAPDLDQQLVQATAQLGQVQAALNQAQAQVSQANANLDLAKVNLARANDLVPKGFETVQSQDTLRAGEESQKANVMAANAGVGVAKANIEAQQATVARLKALVAFENVIAPFDGVITSRNIDIGDLLNADTATAHPMFTMMREDVLRVMVQVPQDAAAGVRDGISANVDLPQVGVTAVEGHVTRTSVALLSSARTLTTEIDIENKNHELRAGLFSYVSIKIPRVRPDVSVPAEALIFGKDGMTVATVGADNKVSIVPVRIFRDFGTSVDVSDGLKGGERVILNPSAGLRDQMTVEVAPNNPPEK